MSVLSRLADARNTAEGKALSVIMASLLVVSTFNVTAWASDAAQETSQDVVTEVSDKKAPEQEPAQTPEPEKKPEAKAPEAQPAPEAEKPAVEAQPEAEAPVAETSGDKTTASLENPAPRPEAEQPAKAPAAPAEDEAPSIATLKLQVTGAEIAYDGKPVAANAQELTVPSGEDAKFTVAAEEGFQLSGQSVQLLSPAGVKCTLAPNAAGEYVVAAEKAETGAAIVVTAEPVVQEPEAPAEEPAEEPATPEVAEPIAPVAPTTLETPSIPAAPTTEQSEALDDFLGIFNGSSTLKVDGKEVIELTVGETVTLKGSEASGPHSWSADKSGIVELGNADKQSVSIKGVSAGEVTLTHTYYKWSNQTETITIVVKEAAPVASKITFNANGATGSVPADIEGHAGSYVTLPAKPADLVRDDYEFLGWCTGADASGVWDGKNGNISGRYPLYGEGEAVQLEEGASTLYAAWAQTKGDTKGKIVAAIIFSEDFIPAEPGIFAGNGFDYAMVSGFEKTSANLLEYFSPAVTTVGVDNVNNALTQKAKDELEAAVKAQFPDYNPETDYLAWHVIKDQRNDNQWHIDGTIQKKGTVKLEYDGNGATSGATPNGQTAIVGTSVTVSGNVNKLVKPGFDFVGWNTASNGSGISYEAGAQLVLGENVTLYAQWSPKTAVRISYVTTVGGSVTRVSEFLNPETGVASGSKAIPETGYQFLGWFEGDTKVADSLEFVPEKPESGWVTATYTAKFAPKHDVKYEVKHYTQNLSRDGYELMDTETHNTGVTNETVSAVPKKYEGFTLNPSAAGTMPSGVVVGDGSLVLKLYYDRNTHTVTYQVTGDHFANAAFVVRENVPFGTKLSLINNDMQKQGYVWSGWTGLPQTMPDADVVVAGSYTPADNTVYTVRHWFQNVDNDEYAQDPSLAPDEEMTGTTGGMTAAAAKTLPGFKAQAIEQETIAADGSTVVDVHYDRNVYTVAYSYGEAPAGASALPEEAAYRYGAEVTVAPAATAPGYTFNGWSQSDAFPMPAEDVTITGTWTANGNTPYRVEYYTRGVSVKGAAGEYELNSTESLTGQTGTTATAVVKDIEGFYHNPDAADTKLSGTISGDGSLVLKVYYDRETYLVTYDYGKAPAGASRLPYPVVAQYGQTVEVAPAATAPGYTFTGWDRGDFKMPAGPVTIRGTWEANPASIQFVANGGSAVETMDGATDEPIADTAMPETTREGYVFAGWYANADLSGEAVEQLPSSYPVGTTTYYAKWDIRTDLGYTVNYYRDAIDEDNLITSETGAGAFQAAIPYDVETNVPYGFTTEGATVTGQETITADSDANVLNVVYPRNVFSIAATIDSNGAIAGNPNQTVQYQGSSEAISFSANPGYRIDHVVVTKETADGETTDNLTPTGTALDYTFDAIDSVEGNYTVHVVTAPLDAVTLTVPSATKTYDGQELAAQAFTVNGLPEGYAVTGNVVGSRTNVGTTLAFVDMDSVVIRDASGADVTDRFRSSLLQTVGTLTVNPAPVVVTAGDAAKVAGEADPTFAAEVSGLVNGESADLINYTMTREAGEDAGTYAVVPTGAAIQGNYEVTYVPGTLTISAAPVVPPVPTDPTTPTDPTVPVTPPTDPTVPVTPPTGPTAPTTPAPAPTPAPTPAPAAPAPAAPAAAGPAPAAAAVVPAAAAVVPAAAEVIADNPTPLADAGDLDTAPVAEVIADDETPMAAFDHPQCWVHYWIFLGILLTLAYAIGVIARRMNYVRKINKFEDDLTGGQSTGDARVTAPLAGGMEA